MNFYEDIYNPAFAAAVSAWLIAQIIKTLSHIIEHRKFSAERFWGAGGMPSSHAAAVCGMATAMAVTEGLNSSLFAVSTLLALVVMYDASGVRRAAGMHAREINHIKRIIEQFNADMRKPGAKTFEETKAHLKELLGHSPFEVFMGALLGIAIGLLFTIVL